MELFEHKDFRLFPHSQCFLCWWNCSIRMLSVLLIHLALLPSYANVISVVTPFENEHFSIVATFTIISNIHFIFSSSYGKHCYSYGEFSQRKCLQKLLSYWFRFSLGIIIWFRAFFLSTSIWHLKRKNIGYSGSNAKKFCYLLWISLSCSFQFFLFLCNADK